MKFPRNFLFTGILFSVGLGAIYGQSSRPDGSVQSLSIGRDQQPVPQNGNGTLGVFFDTTACGLNYVTVSQKLGQRFTPAGVVQPAPFVVSGIPINASIVKAFLIANGSGNGASQTATIAGPAGTLSYPMSISGTDVDMCWQAPATYTYRADVTTVISGNGTYNVSGILTCPPLPSPLTNDMNGAILLVVYNEPTSTTDARLVLSDGALTVPGGSGTYNMTFPPVCTTPASSTGFCLVSDFQTTNCTVTINSLSANVTGNRWNYTSLPANITSGQSSCSFNATKSGDCFCLCLAGLYMQTQTCTTCPSTLPGNLVCNVASTPDNCSSCNGTASVTSVSGGSAPFTFLWSTAPAQTTQTATGLCAGTYTVIVTSNGGLYSDTQSVVVAAQGNGMTSLSFSQVNVSCFGGNDGSASFSVSGGQAPYTFTWSPAAASSTTGNSNSATGLIAGIYTVTATEAGGCTLVHGFIITEPPQFTGSISADSVICFGDSSGSATLSLSGGTPPYNYTWLPFGGNNATGVGLSAQTYTVSVLDNAGCNYVNTITIGQPIVFDISGGGGNVICNGANDGYITTNANGGHPGYTWIWSTGDTTQHLFNLGPGTYSVTATDQVGCTATYSAVITEPTPLVVTSVFVPPSACNAADGSIDITPSGAVGPYYYNWSTNDSTQDISGLPSGVYTVVVSDVSGCSRTEQFILNDPSSPAVTFNEPNDTACSSHSGINLTGYNPPGGIFVGTAVSGDWFYPPLANLGFNYISYVYTDTTTGCTGTAEDSIYVDICNLVSEEINEQVAIYPNPTRGIFYVNCANACRIQVLSTNGQLIKDEWVQNSLQPIDLSLESEGVYLIRISTGYRIQTQKIILLPR